jgi:hypothetical protein
VIRSPVSAIGHVVRQSPVINDNILAALPPDISRSVHTLLHAGLLGQTNELTFNPFPAPGQCPGARDLEQGPRPGRGGGQGGYVYPHINPNC